MRKNYEVWDITTRNLVYHVDITEDDKQGLSEFVELVKGHIELNPNYPILVDIDPDWSTNQEWSIRWVNGSFFVKCMLELKEA